jgi:hypothetical protein
MPYARIEAELHQTVALAKAWDDAVRDHKALTNNAERS